MVVPGPKGKGALFRKAMCLQFYNSDDLETKTKKIVCLFCAGSCSWAGHLQVSQNYFSVFVCKILLQLQAWLWIHIRWMHP